MSSGPRKSLTWIEPGGPLWFPPEEEAQAGGLLAAGGDLSPQRLLYAYSRGIFPWYGEGTPILWWSPEPRCVLFPEELHIPRSLGKVLRRAPYTVSFDQAFTRVIRYCAEVPRPGQRGTWLLPEMRDAYTRLHYLGVAHSVEVWEEGELVGGVYGVALGRIFFGESMFHLRPNASKTALVALIRVMLNHGFVLLDCQQPTPHMLHLGARNIPRRDFLGLTRRYASLT